MRVMGKQGQTQGGRVAALCLSNVDQPLRLMG